MTQAQHPMFEGRRIEAGDTGTVHVHFGEYDGFSNTIVAQVVDGGGNPFGHISLACIASHTPAPRPLVPGPAVYANANGVPTPCTVIGIDGDTAWIRWEQGHRAEQPVAKLRNTLVANPPLAPDRRDVLRLIEKHYHETDAMADALMGLFRSRPESVAQRDGAARVQITPPQSNGLNPDLSSPPPKEAEGWKLVPVEPTPEMLRAAGASPEGVVPRGGTDWLGKMLSKYWTAMLNAAPTPQETQAEESGS